MNMRYVDFKSAKLEAVSKLEEIASYKVETHFSRTKDLKKEKITFLHSQRERRDKSRHVRTEVLRYFIERNQNKSYKKVWFAFSRIGQYKDSDCPERVGKTLIDYRKTIDQIKDLEFPMSEYLPVKIREKK